MRKKPFSHPAIIAVIREAYFNNCRGGSLANNHHGRFRSSVPARPEELEIPIAMLALTCTAVCFFVRVIYTELTFPLQIRSVLDDYSTGIYKKTEFKADMYADIYNRLTFFIEHIKNTSINKYHRMMANLYSEAS